MVRKIFISYSRWNLEQVKAIKKEIELSTGVLCWMDLNAIESGATQFTQDIVDGINGCRVFLFMLSKESQKSKFALRELNFAMKKVEKNKQRHVVIVNIDNCDLTDEFDFMYGLSDTIAWNNQPQREKLLKDVKRWLECEKEMPAESGKQIETVDKMQPRKLYRPFRIFFKTVRFLIELIGTIPHLFFMSLKWVILILLFLIFITFCTDIMKRADSIPDKHNTELLLKGTLVTPDNLDSVRIVFKDGTSSYIVKGIQREVDTLKCIRLNADSDSLFLNAYDKGKVFGIFNGLLIRYPQKIVYKGVFNNHDEISAVFYMEGVGK